MARLGYYINKREDEDTGAAKYGMHLAPYSVIDKNACVKYAQKLANMNAADLSAGFAALGQAISEFVLNGHSVSIDGLGCFTLSCKTGIWDDKAKKWGSAGKTSMGDVSADHIRAVFLRFRPSVEVREEMATTTFFNVGKQKFGTEQGLDKKAGQTAAPASGGTANP